MNQVQINVLMTPFRERFVNCVFCFGISMVWITEFGGKEDLDISFCKRIVRVTSSRFPPVVFIQLETARPTSASLPYQAALSM